MKGSILDTNIQETLQAADNIDTIIANLRDSIDEMMNIIKNAQEKGIRTNWAIRFMDDLKSFKTGDFEHALNDMSIQSANLRLAARGSSKITLGTE